MDHILVNATATRSSGALSILNQFVTHINSDDCNQYCIFVDVNYEEIRHSPNIQYIHIDTRTWRKRIYWDEFGFKNYVLKSGLKPSLIISLQNTGVRFDWKIPQLIYYHQPLPLFPKKWSLFKKQETIYFLYKYVYPLFVSHSIHQNVYIVVQIPSIKKAFVERFKISPERVYVIPPEVPRKNDDNIPMRFFDGYKHFIYPATPLIYKNHILLLQALRLLKEQNRSLFLKMRLHFTFGEENTLHLKDQACKLGVSEAIVYEGVLPFKQLLSYYRSMDALLFPSYIETFGLPLLEAAGSGLPIIASDLPYVLDVIGGYEGVSYCNYKDAGAWASAIETLCQHEKKTYSSFQYPENKGGWKDFFALVETLKVQYAKDQNI